MISKMDIDEKNINSIAKFVGTTRQNIKKMLKPLETKGYVIISKSQQDARALKVELTQKTYQYFIDNDASTTYKANQLFEMFSDEEVNEFMNNLQKLQHCLEIYNERKDKNE
jgi:DNA-binding MarR family transcriptional regulator